MMSDIRTLVELKKDHTHTFVYFLRVQVHKQVANLLAIYHSII